MAIFKEKRSVQPEELSPIKLNKILWFADRKAVLETGAPITNSIYIKKQYGPAIKNIDSFISELVESDKVQTENFTDQDGHNHIYLNSDKDVDITDIPTKIYTIFR